MVHKHISFLFGLSSFISLLRHIQWNQFIYLHSMYAHMKRWMKLYLISIGVICFFFLFLFGQNFILVIFLLIDLCKQRLFNWKKNMNDTRRVENKTSFYFTFSLLASNTTFWCKSFYAQPVLKLFYFSSIFNVIRIERCVLVLLHWNTDLYVSREARIDFWELCVVVWDFRQEGSKFIDYISRKCYV